ncbi:MULTISPECIES: hypothetical protein [unclassified Rhizobium]|uniref:hypothetical protein n=1 Tax=unclassified Rhizobium TaxID=2613769 RepID=UPI0012E3CDC7|nr:MULTISPECIES: hypothetical protein [unclassified Rhizobium]
MTFMKVGQQVVHLHILIVVNTVLVPTEIDLTPKHARNGFVPRGCKKICSLQFSWQMALPETMFGALFPHEAE